MNDLLTKKAEALIGALRALTVKEMCEAVGISIDDYIAKTEAINALLAHSELPTEALYYHLFAWMRSNPILVAPVLTGNVGTTRKFYSPPIVITIPADGDLGELDQRIVAHFQQRPARYLIYTPDEGRMNHVLLDQITYNKVQIAIEPQPRKVVLYPFTNCRSKTIRDICDGILAVEPTLVVDVD